MTAKRVKIKVKKKKISYRKVVIALLAFLCLSLFAVYIVRMPVKNIYIIGNRILSDKKVISISGLGDYPTYLNTYFMDIKSKLLENDYVKTVKIKRKFPNTLYIELEEYKPIAIFEDKVILSSSKMVNNDLEIDYLPYLVNSVKEVYDDFVIGFSKIDDDVLLKISQIEYSPNDVDKKRFILYMVDSNYVYVTLTRIEKVNKYNSIISELDGKKGIIYLDSGDYVEIKDWHTMLIIL